MKQIITTALLLAAGTALANAATVLVDFKADRVTGSSPNAGYSQNNLSDWVSVTWGESTNVALGDDVNWTLSRAGSGGPANGAPGLVNLGSTEAPSGPTWVGGSDALFAVRDTWYVNNGQTLTLTISGFTPDDVIKIDLWGGRESTTTAEGKIVEYKVTAGGNDVRSETFGRSTAFDQDGNILNTMNILSFDNLRADAEGKIVIEMITTSAGGNSNCGLAAMRIETSTIPEPSAFGLLAGLGALALVAARRRRSRKVA